MKWVGDGGGDDNDGSGDNWEKCMRKSNCYSATGPLGKCDLK